MNRDEPRARTGRSDLEEVNDVEEDEVTSDAALLDADGDEDEFVQGSVDADDLATGSTKRFRRGGRRRRGHARNESSQPDGEELPELMTELEVDAGPTTKCE